MGILIGIALKSEIVFIVWRVLASGGNKTDKERHIFCYHVHVKSKKNKRNECIQQNRKKRLTDMENKLVITGEGEWGGEKQGQKIKKYKLLCAK